MPEAPAWRVGVKLPGLRWWRTRRGLNQTELAQMVGVNQSYFTKIETGSRGCSLEVAQKLTKILDVDLEELKGEPDDEPSQEQEAPSRPPARPVVTCRYIHRAHLEFILAREASKQEYPAPKGWLDRAHSELWGG